MKHNKPWKHMALLLGWEESDKAMWFIRIGAPNRAPNLLDTQKFLMHPRYRGVRIMGPHRWARAVKYSLKREKAVGTSRSKLMTTNPTEEDNANP